MSFDDTTLRGNIVTVLSESAISWLNFKCGGLTVASMNFKTVSTYVDTKKIISKVDSTEAKGLAARYDGDSKTMFASTSDITYNDAKSMLVHECTHAVMDVLKVSTKVLADETCAYLAQALYMYVTIKSNVFGAGCAREAYKVVEAKGIAASGQSNVNSPIDFTDADVAPLHKAIKADPLYKNWSSASVYKGFP